MRSANRILPVLYVAAAASLSIALGINAPHQHEPQFGSFGLALSLANLAGIWFVHGRAGWMIRLAITVGVLLAIVWWLDWLSQNPTFAELLCITVVTCAAAATIAGLLRWQGYGWESGREDDSPALSGDLRQFTLGALFTVTTVMAVMLAMMRWMEFPWAHAGEVVALLACLIGISTLMQVLAGWGCIVAALVPAIYLGAVLFPRVYQLRIGVAYALAMGLWVGVMHVAGYRWVRRDSC